MERAVVGKIRELVARGEGSQLGAGVGERDRGLGGERQLEQPRLVAALGDERAPEPSADANRRGAGCALAGPEDACGRLVPFEWNGRSGDEADGAARLAGADDGAEAARLEADDGGGVDAEVDRRLLRDDGEQLDGVGLDRDGVLDALLGAAEGQGGRPAEHGDDAGDEPELVAAGEAAPSSTT